MQTLEFVVPATKTIRHLYPESEDYQRMPEVFATGFMVGLLEWSAILALRPYLEDGEGSVGTRVDISHTAPTPPGAKLIVTACCTKIEDNYIEWDVEARDEDGDVAASGRHGRHIIDIERFLHRVDAKTKRLVGRDVAAAQPA
ncbi:thioesterase family protein [Gandjariella thermophila]|uniref:thioesterase family protein n=1 Tax=Gandjariella thermophila TaxID=1931992 RepID=UPI001CEF7D1C|nr:thioesterase family protein [Gandjariella thermophila]